MISLVVRAAVALAANAIGLLAASALLDDFEIDWSSFIVAVAIFTVATVVLSPLITKIAYTNAPYLVGGVALVTILVGLAITDLLSDAFSIDGAATWIVATLVIWVFSIAAAFVLPWLLDRAAILNPDRSPSSGQRVSRR